MTTSSPAADWYLAQHKPNCGRIAERHLTQQGFRTFLPFEEGMRRVKGRFRSAVQPMFPGYVFVRLDPAQGQWRKVNATTGITRIVSFGATPAVVPCAIVDHLLARCDGSGRLLPAATPKAGDRVRVIQGPLADFVATVESVAPDRRIWLLMEVMGAQTRVAVCAGQLSTQ